MRKLISVILRFHFFILFVVFEVISVSLVITSNPTKKKAFFSSANIVSGYINNQLSNLHSYFNLGEENEKLAKENIKLLTELNAFKQSVKQSSFELDTSNAYRYEYLNAHVIKNTVSLSHNFITIDKGEKDGIQKDFGVIGTQGVVGIIVATSKHYSLVISLLNERIGLSARIKKNNFFGTIKWNGNNYRLVKLSGIPNHLNLQIGDTIVTSGYSAIFPENITIGVINKFKKDKSTNFFDIDVMLSTDMKNLYNVHVVNNKNKREQILLENTSENEY